MIYTLKRVQDLCLDFKLLYKLIYLLQCTYIPRRWLSFEHLSHTYLYLICVICIVLKGTVDSNLGQDLLSGKKGFRFQLLQIICTKSLMCIVMSCSCLGPRHSPYTYYLCLLQQQYAQRLTSEAGNGTHHLPDDE